MSICTKMSILVQIVENCCLTFDLNTPKAGFHPDLLIQLCRQAEKKSANSTAAKVLTTSNEQLGKTLLMSQVLCGDSVYGCSGQLPP